MGNEGPPQSAVGTQQAPAIEYVGGTGRAPEGSGIRVVVVLSALFIVLLAGGAVVANAVLSSIYSPEHTVQDYFAAQSHGDALGMYSRATYLRGGSSYDRFFSLTALQAMMKLSPNTNIRGVRITGTRLLSNSVTAVKVSLLWAGTQRSQELMVRKDPTRKNLLIYPYWRVLISPSSIGLKLPNQPGDLTLDGRSAPNDSATPLQVIPGFHRLTMARSLFWNEVSEQVNAVEPVTVAITGTINDTARANALATVRNGTCDIKDPHLLCFDHTYTAPNDGRIYYMTLPGYGKVDFRNYRGSLDGDFTADMKLIVSAEPNKATATGSCVMTLTVNGSRKYRLKGVWHSDLTWRNGAFDTPVVLFNCLNQRA